MSEELHESHRWGERPFYGEMSPACLDCRVWGFEDEPAAFEECPGPPEIPEKKAKDKSSPCWKTMESTYLPGHTHLCELASHTGDHICSDPTCRRRFGKR
jgi:hypothetical protein